MDSTPKSSQENKSIIDQFTPDILGLFWITDESLNRTLKNFSELNYLFDGLLSEYLYSREKETGYAHIFFSQNFNYKIFIAHLKSQNLTKSQLAGDIDEQISLITNDSSERKTILILNETSEQWLQELQKRYSKFEFKSLT
jgi:hypothetical protein